MMWATGRCHGRIEIEVCGARIRVEPGVDAATLATVLSVVKPNFNSLSGRQATSRNPLKLRYFILDG
jgi:hypothetical protein